ncbi:hypothetical protein BBJ28_00002226 [Nothophytophthora sp. Chile5]|nr:hypothetical protein BBJ28_00002226 [Nothophytophthora sp. Chile5]
MVGVVLSESERLNLVGQGNAVFIEVLARLYNAQVRRSHYQRQERHRAASLESRGNYLTLLDRHTVYGSLAEVADLYLNDEKKMVLDFSESRELVVLQPTSKTRPLEHTCLRWSLFRSPNRRLAKDQDFCYLEVMKPYTAHDGRRGWAKCSHSITHAACPEFTHSSVSSSINVNRGELRYCGVFFQETDQLGVLDAIFYYNIKRDNIPQVLVPIALKSRGKRNAELLNHYVKMSRMILESKTRPLSLARQLQTEKRCGACSNRMPKWKPKDKCTFCGAFMCRKCSAIVCRNYRISGASREQIVCFACADQRGTKLMLGPEPLDGNSEDSGSVSQSVTTTEGDEDERGETTGSVASIYDDIYPLSFEDEGKPIEALQGLTLLPLSFGLLVLPDATFRVPIDDAPWKLKSPPPRRNSRETRHRQTRLQSDFDNLKLRQRSHTSASSAGQTSAAGGATMRRRLSPSCSLGETEATAADRAGFAALGSPVGLNLEEVNLRLRRYTTDAVPRAAERTGRGARDHTREAREGQHNHIEAPRTPASPSPSSTAMLYWKPSPTERYSKANLCDLSYLTDFK